MRIPTFIAALVVAVSPLLGATADADGGPYPVWFNPGLGIESVEDVVRKLDESIPGRASVLVMAMPTYRDSFDALLKGDLDSRFAPLPVRTCTEYLKAIDKGYRAIGEIGGRHRTGELYFAQRRSELEAYEDALLDCQITKRLKDARPAESSHVRGLLGEEQAQRRLLAILIDGGDVWERVRIDVAANGSSIDYDATYHDRRRLIIHLRLLCLADFDGDGIEEAFGTLTRFFIQRESIPGKAQRHAFTLFRDTANGELRAVWLSPQ